MTVTTTSTSFAAIAATEGTSFTMFLVLTVLLLAILAIVVRAIDFRRWVPAGLAAVVAAAAVALLGGFVLFAWNGLARTTHARAAYAARADANAPLETARAAPRRLVAARAGEPQGERRDAEPTADEDTAAAEPAGADEPLAIPINAETAALAKRPAWVESPPVWAPTGEVLQKAIASEPFEKQRDCRRDLDRQLKQTVAEYVDDYFEESYGERLKASDGIQYDANYIKSHLVKPDHLYQESLQLSVGPMQRLHALLVFDDAFRQELESRRPELERHWRDRVATGRVLVAGLSFGLVLSLVGLAWGYLKIDARTGGKNSRRLQLVGGTAILALIAAGILLARQIR